MSQNIPDIIEKHLTFEIDGMQIPAELTMPEHEDVRWCVVIVPGSFFSDVDGNYSMKDGNPFEARPHAYADLARQLVRRGHAVLRYARAGMITVDKEKAMVHKRFGERVAVAAEACRTARELVPDAEGLCIAGHSEGSVVSLLLLTGHPDVKIDAYISLSGPAYRFFDLMIGQAKSSVQNGMLSFGDFKYPFALYKRSIEAVRAGAPIPEKVKKALPPYGVHAMDDASKQYLRDYDSADSISMIAQVSCPVLIIQGGQDTSVFSENADMLFEARHESKSNTARAIFPDLQHFYKRVPKDMSAMEAFLLDSESDECVSDAISKWLDLLR